MNKKKDMNPREISWHSLSIDKILKILSSSKRGLKESEANFRLKKFGLNSFTYSPSHQTLKLFLNQIKSPLVFILILAGIVTLILGSYTDSLVILIAVSINTAIGFFQEGRASQAFEKLQASQKKFATVLREGQKRMIDALKIVPGDILVVQAGDQIPADARILEARNLRVNESVLTGEWLSVEKKNIKLSKETHFTERANMIWKGTLVVEGWAKAIVVATGFKTEIGKIAEFIKKETFSLTPFQRSIKKLARFLGILIAFVLFLIFILGVFRGHKVEEMFFMSVAVAVAAIPEGLPVAVSVVLALGMNRILAKGGLIKRMSAAETLGSVDIILTDKTGTLTQSLMRVSNIITLNQLLGSKDEERLKILEMAILASDAFVENPQDNFSDWKIRGRPIEQALLLAGIDMGLNQDFLLKKYPRLDFLSFDAERRFAVSLNKINEKEKRVFISGAPEFVLKLSKKVLKGNNEINLDLEKREMFKKSLEKYASYGLRIIAVGYKKVDWPDLPIDSESFSDFVFGGLIVFYDPLRPNVPLVVKQARKAGIKTIMVTGDHQKTAKKIAQDIGIFTTDSRIVNGKKLDLMTEKDLLNSIEKISVYARVLPHQKLRIVKAWQAKDKVVAMTGDGVNDAPALKRAEIGVALGSGTEVAKEASDLVLLNNSFSVIISAIEEGRRILSNLQKVLIYLLSTGFSEIVLIAVSLIFAFPLPVLATQILWSNIIEEGFMNFAFAFEPKDKDLMKKKPSFYSANSFFTREIKTFILAMSFITSVILIGLFVFLYLIKGYSIEHTRTVVFAALSIDSVFFVFSLRDIHKPLWRINLFSNKYLILAVITSLFFLALALFVPPLMSLLTLSPLTLFDFFLILSVGFLNLFSVEVLKRCSL